MKTFNTSSFVRSPSRNTHILEIKQHRNITTLSSLCRTHGFCGFLLLLGGGGDGDAGWAGAGRGGLYSVIWIPILDPDYRYRPKKTISPVVKGREHAPSLSVCLYGLSVCDAACLLGVYGLS